MRFLLVDSILELESGQRAIGIKNVTMSEDFLADHFPDRPIMPGMLILEALVQLADWLVREASDFEQLGLARAFDRVKFRRLVSPGDQLRLEVEVTGRADGEVQFRGRAYRVEELATSANLTLALEQLDGYVEPDQARRAFRLLCRDGAGGAQT
jgi:3-hydroxyacyl-[acyl-carrier-protein] dehydratase